MSKAESMEELEYWLALRRLRRVGAAGYAELINRYGGARAVFEHGPGDPSLGEDLRSALRSPDWSAVETDLDWAAAPGRSILTLQDPKYPELLQAIPDPPLVLYVSGNPSLLSAIQLAIVGSRNPSRLGEEIAHEFAASLARLGIVITSGLALGIDGAAHRGALAADGPTLAVAGTGLDRVYPARHKDLAHDIVNQGGLLVSEFCPGTPPRPHNFPRRNRIISGLTLGTLVVEAALRSGSLVTARLAMEQGREVFAIPGSIHNPLARGCHQLIRQGAKLVESVQDMIEELAPQLKNALEQSKPPVGLTQEEEADLDEDYGQLLTCIGYEPCAVDLIVERSGLTPETVSSMLLQLELQGYVSPVIGGYARTSKRN